jgi:short-subunit dehydrogenase
VVAVARRGERLEALAGELGRERLTPLVQDLADPGAAAAIDARLRELGRFPDLLVNNAGLGATGRFWEADPDRLQQIVHVNAGAVVSLTRRLLPGMLERRRGRILNVVSMSAFQPVPFLTVYAASKAFVLSFSEGLARELAGTGVTVVALCPGLVRTEFQAAAGTDRVAYDGSPAVPVETVVLAGIAAGRTTVIPGWRDRASVAAQRLLPRSLVARVAGELFRPR